MIVQIRGIYLASSPRGVLLEAGPLTYDIGLTSYTRDYFTRTYQPGEQVSLYTIYYIESNLGGGHLSPTMLGFTSEAERDFFQLFTSVAKIGNKTALTALSLPVNAMAVAIENGDAYSLKQLKGIGERTAHKIIASLKGKVAGFITPTDEKDGAVIQRDETSIDDEAVQVLLQLGYGPSEAKKMVKEASANSDGRYSIEELLTEIYKAK